MKDGLNQIIENIDPIWAYVVLFFSAIIENLFPPIPGDTVTVFGAYLITTGQLGFWGVYLSTTLGSIVGFNIMYLIGIKFGRSFLNSKFRARLFSEKQFNKVQRWFAKYGYTVILANRFMSGTRSVISLFAGFFHLNWLLVLGLSALSAFIWNGLLIYAGYLLGVNWDVITGIIKHYNNIVIIATVIAVFLFIMFRRRRKRKRQETAKVSDQP